MRAKDFLTDNTIVKDRSGGIRSITTPRVGGFQAKQTFRPDATPGYQQANYKSGGIELDAKGSPETGYTQSVASNIGGMGIKNTQRYSGQKQMDVDYNLGNDTKLSARSTVSKPGAKPVNQMSITKGGKTTTVTNDINEKPLDDITLQRTLKFGNEIDADKERNPGAYSMTSKATKDLIAKARAQEKSQRVTNVPARAHDKDGVHKQGFKPVTFPKSNSMSNASIAMDDINEAFEYAIAQEAREIDPKKMQAYMDFKKENNIDGSSVRMAVDNPDHPETKRMMQNKNFAKAVSMYKAALVNEDVSELTFEDDDQFFEDFGYLGYSIDENDLFEAEYRGRKVKLNKPMQGDVKKFKVYVKNKKGNVIKVNFGHGGSSVKGKTMRIRKNNPKARANFRARHNCDNPGPKTKARYWSCRKW